MPRRYLLTALLGLFFSSFATAHEYYARNFNMLHPWSVASDIAADNASVYFKFTEILESDRLLRAVTPLAESVEFRSGIHQDVVLPDLVINKGDEHDFPPGGPHIMLVKLRAPLMWGRSYPMVLYFEKAGMINITVSIGAH